MNPLRLTLVSRSVSTETRWRFALEGAGDGVWDWDTETNRVFFSSNWKAMLGYGEEEIEDELEEWSSTTGSKSTLAWWDHRWD